jgi:hypothetical protein
LRLGTESNHLGHHPEQRGEPSAEIFGLLGKPSAYKWLVVPTHALARLDAEADDVFLVAITRAEALLIVVGDPEVLGKDKLWRTFLNYIKLSKGWTGKGHSWDAEEVVHVPGYEIVPRKGGIVHGDEFIDGKSEMIYRVVEADSM